MDLWTQTCECITWAGGWNWGGEPWEGRRAPGSLKRTKEEVSKRSRHFWAPPFKKKKPQKTPTHVAVRFGQTTSAAAAARTGPTPRARRDSEVAPRETRRPAPPRTGPSGTKPGNTGRAAGWPRNGTLLSGGRRREVSLWRKNSGNSGGLRGRVPHPSGDYFQVIFLLNPHPS